MKFKKTYKFAFWSSLYFTIVTGILLVVFSLISFNEIPIKNIISVNIALYFLAFIIIQYRVEKFIYKRIKKIYNDVSLLDIKDLNRNSITTDMKTLSVEVKKFAEDKRLEIATLNEREAYRRELLGNISHELKTPLFTVQGYIITLLNSGAIEDKIIREKYLNRANKGVERLVDIVKDLDLISKFEGNDLHLNIKTFDCVEVIQNVFELLEIKAKKRKVTLSLDKKYNSPILVLGDVDRIERVFINLIVNSIKYGIVGGMTTVKIEPVKKNLIRFHVIDNGEGIHSSCVSRLFERFYRIEKSRSRDQGGSGLGLSIVKHIIEAHNEKIEVKSTLGKGSDFHFTLPRAPKAKKSI